MDKIDGTLTFVDKNGDDKSVIRAIEGSKEVKIGSNLLSDIVIKSEEVEELHCLIYLNELNKVKIRNFSKSHPISVNNQVVDSTKDLKSGDVITILDKSMRWETKADAKRRFSYLTKEERKAFKQKYVKTNKRITIHSVSIQSMIQTSPEESASSSSAEKISSTPETPESIPELEENSTPVKEQTGQTVPMDKENEKTPVKLNKLNMSGTLCTSYTPQLTKVTRSVSKTPYTTPLRSPLVKSAAKSLLNDSLNISNVDSPNSAQRLNNSQMVLVDLTTPYVKRTDTSTPKASTLRKTPRTIGKTPRNATLLKSAIKNSSIKKNVQQNASNIVSKGKSLFESPAKQDTSSLIEVSLSSVEEVDTSKASSDDNSNLEQQKVEENNGKTSNDEVKDILESISSVLDDDDNKGDEEAPEMTSSQEIEKNFDKIVDAQKLSMASNNESLFDKALNTVPVEDINNFDNLVTETATNDNDDPEKKGEIVLKLIEKARESLSTPNKTTQVLSSRYSNVTNDSLNESVHTLQKYDATTPKVSLLEAVISARKSEINSKLTISPVSRLTLTKDSTEIVENYQLNRDNSRSLKSTRKHMKNAMSSLLNDTTSADTTINESLNTSINDKVQDDANQSQVEESNILSLDNQPDLNTSNKENEFSGALNASLKFEYSECDVNNQEVKVIFEIGNDGNDMIESENELESSSEEEEDESPNEEMLDEPLDEENVEHDDNPEPDNLDEKIESNESAKEVQIAKKCRISQEDLEDGIDFLDESKEEDQLEQMLKEDDIEMKEITEPEKLEGTVENNSVDDFDEIPETQQMEEEIGEKEVPLEKSEYLDDIPETQDIEFGTNEEFNSNSTMNENTEDSPKEEEIVKFSRIGSFVPILQHDDKSENGSQESLENVSVEPQESLENVSQSKEQSELPVENKANTLDDTVEQLDDTSDDHVEIPATQAFDFEESVTEETEKMDDTIEDIPEPKEEKIDHNLKSTDSIVEINDSTIYNSQEPVNKSDTVESISIQEISDSSEICSQGSNLVKQDEITNQPEKIESNEIINKSIVEETCSTQESKETFSSLDSNVSETINELIAAPTDVLTNIAVVQQFSTSEITSDHEEIPATQDILDNESNDNVVEEKTLEGDSAIESSSKIDQSNESEERRDNRESVLFSDTEFSHVDINASSFLKEVDSNESREDVLNGQENDVVPENVPDDIGHDEESDEQTISEEHPENLQIMEDKISDDFPIMEVKEPEITEENICEDVTNNIETEVPSESSILCDTPSKGNEISETISDEQTSEIEEKELESTLEEQITEEPEFIATTSEKELEPENEVLEQDEIMETQKESEEVVQEDIVQTEEIVPQSEIEEPTAEIVPNESLSQEEIEARGEIFNGQENDVIPENITDDMQNEEELNEQETSEEHPENLQLMEIPRPENLQLMEVTKPEKLQIMEVTKPEKLQVMEITKSDHLQIVEAEKPEITEENICEDVTNNVEMEVQPESSILCDTPSKENEILEPVSEEQNSEIEEKEPEPTIEEQINEDPELIATTSEKELEPENKVLEQDEIMETTQKESEEVVQEEIVKSEKIDSQPEISTEIEEQAVPKTEEVPSEILPQEEIVPKPVETVIEPQTPTRKRAKKLNYLELASGSPARTPRRGRAASTEEKQEKSKKPEPPPTISEEISDKTRDEQIVTSTTDDTVTKEVVEADKELEHTQEVKKKPGRARKIDQLKPDTEDIPTPSKRLRRGVTPVQPVSVNEPEKKPRKRQQKVVEKEPEKSHEMQLETAKNIEPESEVPEVITISSEENSNETKKVPAKKGRGRQPKVVEEVPQEEEQQSEKVESQPVKKGRSRKAKVDEVPVVEEKLPEKVETSPKRGRGRKAVVEKSEIEKVDETPIAKKSRKRQHDKPTEVENPKDTEDIRTDEIPAKNIVESPQPAKKRNRAAAKAPENVEEQVQPEKAAPKRGRKGKAEAAIPEIEEQPESAPKRAVRKGKTEEIVETQEEPAQEAPKKGRGRKNKAEEPPKQPEVEHEKVEPVSKRTGRKGKNDHIAEVHELPAEEPAPPKRAAGRKAKVDSVAAEVHDNPVQETPKRGGRKGKIEPVPEIQEQQHVEEVAPKRAGRKAKTDVVTESHKEPEVQEAPKKGRGRKAKVEEPAKEEEPQSSTNVQEETIPVKKGRGRQKEIETKTEEKTEEAPKRGRAQKHKDVEPDTTEQPVIKKPRGRQAKQDVDKKVEEPESVSTETPKRAKTTLKKNDAAKHVTIITPSTMQAHHSKETTKSEDPVVAPKRATKRQIQPIVEEEPIAAKRPTRVRK